ncbi:hypothetical protein EV143_1056 [Flavobacterium chryseum]|nr:hypothetical protein EV143_1056 [Flavobacterium sp. P3160]
MRTLLLIIYCVFTSLSYSQEQKFTPKLKLAMETYAFLKGQSAALKKVGIQFPELQNDVKAVADSSQLVFGRAEKNIDQFLKYELDNVEFTSMQRRIDSLLNEHLKHPIQKEEYARNFLKKVRFELLLSKADDIQKSIISFAYYDAPHQEVIDGHVVDFTTNRHPKAEKSAVKVIIPKSWRAEEAEMSETVQQFTSHDGKGSEKILIVVHDLTAEDKNIILNKKTISEMVSSHTNIIRTETITIDGLPGMMIEVEEILNLSDTRKKIRMLQFMFAYNQKLYCLQGSIGPADINQNLDRHIKKYEPLFRLIAAGTQIVD